MLSLEQFLERVRGRLIVSCQALPDEPLHGTDMMAYMALAAWKGGCGYPGEWPRRRAIRALVPLPIIGIFKDGSEGVYITTTFEHAKAIVDAGAEVIGLDGTLRARPDGSRLPDLIGRIQRELGVPVIADVSTLDEAVSAEGAGADFVAPTLVGYTSYSPQRDSPDFELLRAMVTSLHVPIIAEGDIRTPEEARQALECGPVAVVVGSAITRPQTITARFVKQLQGEDWQDA